MDSDGQRQYPLSLRYAHGQSHGLPSHWFFNTDTFSSFGGETFTLLREGKTLLALVNIGAQLLFGLAAVWVGYRFGMLIETP